MTNINEKIDKYLTEKSNILPIKDRKLDRLFTNQEFWIVTNRNIQNSDYEDNVYKANIEDFILQVAGGLDLGDLAGIYTTEEEAKDKYQELINKLN